MFVSALQSLAGTRIRPARASSPRRRRRQRDTAFVSAGGSRVKLQVVGRSGAPGGASLRTAGGRHVSAVGTEPDQRLTVRRSPGWIVVEFRLFQRMRSVVDTPCRRAIDQRVSPRRTVTVVGPDALLLVDDPEDEATRVGEALRGTTNRWPI